MFAMPIASSLRGLAVGAAALLLSAAGAVAAPPKVAVITPYLAQPGTQFYVEAFQAAAKTKGWDVNVIDTKGDVAAVISRIEDMVTQKVDAIVINVDPVAGRRRPAGGQGRAASRSSAWTPAAIRFSSPTSPATATRWRRRPRSTSPTASAATATS